MPGALRSSAVVLAAAAAVLGAPEAGARPGEVVRVERPRGLSSTGLRLCPVNLSAQGRVTCFGERPPAPGTRFVLLDGEGSRGHVIARRVQPSEQDRCGLGYLHDVAIDGEISGGDLGVSVAVQGLGEADDARVLPYGLRSRSPSGRDEDQVWMAIDRDGDDLADVLATYRECAAEPGMPLPPVGKTVQGLCLDYWALRRGEWRRLGSDVYYDCR